MKRIAVAYNNSEAGSPVREEMKRKFLAMYDHITDQGVAYGSCWAIFIITDIACADFIRLIS